EKPSFRFGQTLNHRHRALHRRGRHLPPEGSSEIKPEKKNKYGGVGPSEGFFKNDEEGIKGGGQKHGRLQPQAGFQFHFFFTVLPPVNQDDHGPAPSDEEAVSARHVR